MRIYAKKSRDALLCKEKYLYLHSTKMRIYANIIESHADRKGFIFKEIDSTSG